MDWSRKKCLELIDQFERHPVLWDPTNGCYFNKIKKHDAWAVFAKNMGCAVDDIKKKMESLLSSFRREKAKGKKSVGTGRGREDIYVSKWFAFPRMAFLLDKDKPRPTIDSIEENDNAEPDSEDDIPENVTTEPEATNSQGIENEEPEAQGLAGNNTLPSKPSTSATPRKQFNKRRKLNESVEVSKVDQALGFLKNAASNSDLKGDECGVYGQHVAHKLRSYSKKTRAVVQHHINNIIFSADMGQYDIGEARGAYHAFNTPALGLSQYSHQSSHNQIPVPSPSSHSQLSYSHQSSSHIIPVPSPTPHSQLSYSQQLSPNAISVSSPSPHSHFSYSHQPSPNQTVVPNSPQHSQNKTTSSELFQSL